MKTQTIIIEGMTCNHCVMSVRKHLAQLEGLEVEDVQIGSATVSYEDTKLSQAVVDDAITTAGFTVTAHE
jgi:copper chaperone